MLEVSSFFLPPPKSARRTSWILTSLYEERGDFLWKQLCQASFLGLFFTYSAQRVSEAATAPIEFPSYASSRGSAESATDHCDETCEDETHTQEGTPNHDDKLQRKLEELRSQNERLKSQNENLLTEADSLAHQLRQKEAAPKKLRLAWQTSNLHFRQSG